MQLNKFDEKSVEITSRILINGGVVILPTDTVYGFSGVTDFFETDAKIRKIKGRAETKPFIQLIAKPEDIKKYTNDYIPEKVLSFWPGPLTVIVNDNRNENLTTAFRCPGDKWLRDVIEKTDSPLYSTSVNRSGSPVLQTEKEIINEFENEVDLIVLAGDTNNALPSTIIKIQDGEIVVIREGAISVSELKE